MAGAYDRTDKDMAAKKAAVNKANAVSKKVADVLPKKTTISSTDISNAYKASLADTSKVDSNYAQKALKDSNYGISQAKDALAKATKSGNKAKIAEAKTLLARAQDANSALKDVLKSMGYNAQTGTLPEGAGGAPSGGGTDTGGGTGGSDIVEEDSPIGGKTPAQVQADADRRDAFALLKDIFAQYGLEDLASTIEGYMKDDIGVNQATLLLKQTPAYQTRFAGNQMRLKAGLNVLSEAEYLALENSYSETLKAYGQAGYFGTDRVARQAKLAAAIGADISAVEFKDRISTVVDRVTNADPAVKSTLRSFYNITDEDLVGYFLNPKENLPRLKEKVTSAEIGTSAFAQGLTSNVASAEELAKYGVDLETARKGYATIADILPTASKLGDIYKEEGIKYTQGMAEEETFKGLASAQRKRQRLAEKEIASFSGQSGVTRGSLSTGTSGLI
jgi:hypothetical protein